MRIQLPAVGFPKSTNGYSGGTHPLPPAAGKFLRSSQIQKGRECGQRESTILLTSCQIHQMRSCSSGKAVPVSALEDELSRCCPQTPRLLFHSTKSIVNPVMTSCDAQP